MKISSEVVIAPPSTEYSATIPDQGDSPTLTIRVRDDDSQFTSATSHTALPVAWKAWAADSLYDFRLAHAPLDLWGEVMSEVKMTGQVVDSAFVMCCKPRISALTDHPRLVVESIRYRPGMIVVLPTKVHALADQASELDAALGIPATSVFRNVSGWLR